MVRRMNKKGSGRDLIFFIAFLFFIGIGFFVGFRTYDTIKTELIDNSPVGDNQQATDALNDVADTIAMFDYFFIVLFISMILGMMISSFLVDIHPIFYVFFVLMWIIAIMIATILAVTYQDMSAFEYFSTMETAMPSIHFVFQNLPILSTVVGFLLVIVMFVKTRNPYTGV